MRYFISSHGCYVNDKKVSLKDVTLLFYAQENECVFYNNKFLKSFCNESINKRKEYKPVFKKRGEYFQMEFSREEGANYDCYIYCCTTKERIYNFKSGDLLLSQVIDLVTLHNNSYSDSPIYLSMLTCNSECSTENENRGRKLHRKRSFRAKGNFFPESYTKEQSEKNSHLSKTLRKRIPSLKTNTLKSRHILKSGDYVLSKGKIVQVVKKDKKWFSVNGEELVRKEVTYLPDIEEGQTVMYKRDLWTVEETGPELSIRNIKSRAEKRVNSRDVVALDY
jgi:hypothetical protein